MASADDLLTSPDKIRYLKYMVLLVDGGTKVLRYQLEIQIQPNDLDTHLQQPEVEKKIEDLVKKKRIINDQMKSLLYPTADVSKLDVTMLCFLLRNVSRLDHNSEVWDLKIPPIPTDISVEADIVRLRLLRNEHLHASTASLTSQEFKQRWENLQKTLERLGNGITNLPEIIDKMKKDSIDPAREQELLDQIKEWEDRDQPFTEIHSKLDSQSAKIDLLSTDVSTVKSDVASLKRSASESSTQDTLSQLEQKQSSQNEESRQLKETVQGLEVRHENLKRDVRGVQKDQANQLSSELRSILSRSSMEIDERMAGEPYIQTGLHIKAKEILQQHKLVVLSGSPGEGKTQMSIHLAAEIACPKSCLIIHNPEEWFHVEMSTDQIKIIIIDDIFGSGVMDERLVKTWKKILHPIRIFLKKSFYLIVTTRHYILHEAEQTRPLFKKENVLQISSNKLSSYEKNKILKTHLDKKKRSYAGSLIPECSSKFVKDMFGFPQCVDLFVGNDELFQRGAEFFAKPFEFFRDNIAELQEDGKKFFALILIWCREGRPLLKSELAIDGSISEELKVIAQKFGFAMNPDLVKLLKRSVEYHTDGLIEYNARQGSYKLSHHVVEDMVGLVASHEHSEAVIEYCSRGFFLEYITIDESKQDSKDHLYVSECMFRDMSKKLVRLILTPPPDISKVDVKRFKSGGKCANKVTPTSELDSELVLRPYFKDAEFVRQFVTYIGEESNRENTRKLLGSPVLNMSGYFLKRGILLNETQVCLAQFSLLNEFEFFPKELLKQQVFDFNDAELSLMIAVHHSQRSIIEGLLNAGATVTEDVIYIAAVKEDAAITTLLMSNEKRVSQSKHLHKGTSALIVSAKKGLVKSVKCLIENGSDVKHVNTDGMTALDKAIIYKHVKICKLLIDAGSPLTERHGKFKRTPLHIAADVGLKEIVSYLLSKPHPPVKTKDHRGQYPLQIAAIRGHTEIVKLILEFDKNLVRQRIISYGSKSPFRGGMTVYHIAVWKNNTKLLKALVEMGLNAKDLDVYGRSPLYCAAFDGKLDLVKILIPVSDTKKAEKQGFTPLHAAIHKGHVKIAKVLCPHSNLNAADKFGKTVFHVAARKKLKDVLDLLQDPGTGASLLKLVESEQSVHSSESNSETHLSSPLEFDSSNDIEDTSDESNDSDDMCFGFDADSDAYVDSDADDYASDYSNDSDSNNCWFLF